MRTCRTLLPATALSLALLAIAPAAGAGPPGAEIAAKCKKRQLAVGGKCAPTFKGKPAAITIGIRGSKAVFRWAPLKCPAASGLPNGVTKNATVKNKRIRIDSAIGNGYRVRFNGELVAPKAINGQASIFRSGRVACFRAVGLKR